MVSPPHLYVLKSTRGLCTGIKILSVLISYSSDFWSERGFALHLLCFASTTGVRGKQNGGIKGDLMSWNESTVPGRSKRNRLRE